MEKETKMKNDTKRKTSTKKKAEKPNFYKDVKDLRMIDDLFFRLAASRVDVCQEILRTLLDEEELVVVSVAVQDEKVNLYRKVRLDALCILSDGRVCNIEMQKGDRNDDIRRVRFHASAITTNETPKGTEFTDIPDVKVVYITEYDALNNQQLITPVKRCQKKGDEYIPIDDGEEIYFANTVIKDQSKKSKLLGYFLESKSFDDPEFPAISSALQYFKNTDEGMIEMKSASERFYEKGVESEKKNTEREKERADKAEARADEEKSRADAAEAENKRLREELALLQKASTNK